MADNPHTVRVPVSVRMPRSLNLRLAAVAARRNMTLNELMLELMEAQLKEADDGAGE